MIAQSAVTYFLLINDLFHRKKRRVDFGALHNRIRCIYFGLADAWPYDNRIEAQEVTLSQV